MHRVARKLSREAADNNPRLREPLLLYAIFHDKTELLLSEVKNDPAAAEIIKITKRYDKKTIKQAMENKDKELPPEYVKVWKSYLSERDRVKTDERTKDLLRERVLFYQRQKNVSIYRVYTDLSLNHGNINAWLKHGDGNKVSLDTARKILRYLEEK